MKTFETSSPLYEVGRTMARMGQRTATVIWTEELEALPVGSIVVHVEDGKAWQSFEESDGPYWSQARLQGGNPVEHLVSWYPDDLWIVVWRGQQCLKCYRFGTHKFAVAGKVDGWLCEEHKDDAVQIADEVYGEKERR